MCGIVYIRIGAHISTLIVIIIYRHYHDAIEAADRMMHALSGASIRCYIVYRNPINVYQAAFTHTLQINKINKINYRARPLGILPLLRRPFVRRRLPPLPVPPRPRGPVREAPRRETQGTCTYHVTDMHVCVHNMTPPHTPHHPAHLTGPIPNTNTHTALCRRVSQGQQEAPQAWQRPLPLGRLVCRRPGVRRRRRGDSAAWRNAG